MANKQTRRLRKMHRKKIKETALSTRVTYSGDGTRHLVEVLEINHGRNAFGKFRPRNRSAAKPPRREDVPQWTLDAVARERSRQFASTRRTVSGKALQSLIR